VTLKNETGNRYGKLLVRARQPRPDTSRAYWICECDCGTVKPVLGDHLRSGAIISCSCVGASHRFKPVEKPHKPKRKRAPKISKKAPEIRHHGRGEGQFIEQHVYRQIPKLPVSPIVEAALEAVREREKRKAA
jgi:hypothetical protein